MNLQNLKFPIGQFVKPERITQETLETWVNEIALFPYKIDSLTAKLSSQELEFPYRPGGWTIRQVVHHCADSHSNMFIRVKLAITENVPVISPYNQNKWIELADSEDTDITGSLALIEALHYKWVLLLKSFDIEHWHKQFFHPGYGKIYTLNEAIGAYAWHGNHHVAHIEQALTHKGIFENK